MKAFDLRPIVRNFYSGIFEDSTRPNREAYALLAIPVILAPIGLVSPLTDSIIFTISTALAILFGFTFTSLLQVARYSSKSDQIEQKIVRETRIGMGYALLVNLIALISVVSSAILLPRILAASPLLAKGTTVIVYFLIFHYFIVMLYMMKYLYLLAVGGAFELEKENSQSSPSAEIERTI